MLDAITALCPVDQFCCCKVVGHIGDRAVHHPPHRLVNDMQRHQEPLPGPDWVPEAVLDSQVQLSRSKDAMEQVLQLRAVDTCRAPSRPLFDATSLQRPSSGERS